MNKEQDDLDSNLDEIAGLNNSDLHDSEFKILGHTKEDFGVLLGVCILCVPLLVLGFDCFQYLKTGAWQPLTLSTFTDFRAATSWLGLNDIVNWTITQLPLWAAAIIVPFAYFAND